MMESISISKGTDAQGEKRPRILLPKRVCGLCIAPSDAPQEARGRSVTKASRYHVSQSLAELELI